MKVIAGYPIPMEGESVSCVHFSPTGNLGCADRRSAWFHSARGKYAFADMETQHGSFYDKASYGL
jgi:hypothetical protein